MNMESTNEGLQLNEITKEQLKFLADNKDDLAKFQNSNDQNDEDRQTFVGKITEAGMDPTLLFHYLRDNKKNVANYSFEYNEISNDHYLVVNGIEDALKKNEGNDASKIKNMKDANIPQPYALLAKLKKYYNQSSVENMLKEIEALQQVSQTEVTVDDDPTTTIVLKEIEDLDSELTQELNDPETLEDLDRMQNPNFTEYFSAPQTPTEIADFLNTNTDFAETLPRGEFEPIQGMFGKIGLDTFASMNPSTQVDFINRMSPEQRKDFLNHLSPRQLAMLDNAAARILTGAAPLVSNPTQESSDNPGTGDRVHEGLEESSMVESPTNAVRDLKNGMVEAMNILKFVEDPEGKLNTLRIRTQRLANGLHLLENDIARDNVDKTALPAILEGFTQELNTLKTENLKLKTDMQREVKSLQSSMQSTDVTKRNQMAMRVHMLTGLIQACDQLKLIFSSIDSKIARIMQFFKNIAKRWGNLRKFFKFGSGAKAEAGVNTGGYGGLTTNSNPNVRTNKNGITISAKAQSGIRARNKYFLPYLPPEPDPPKPDPEPIDPQKPVDAEAYAKAIEEGGMGLTSSTRNDIRVQRELYKDQVKANIVGHLKGNDLSNQTEIDAALDYAGNAYMDSFDKLSLQRMKHIQDNRGPVRKAFGWMSEGFENLSPLIKMPLRIGLVLGASAFSPPLGAGLAISLSAVGLKRFVRRGLGAVRRSTSGKEGKMAISHQELIRDLSANRLSDADRDAAIAAPIGAGPDVQNTALNQLGSMRNAKFNEDYRKDFKATLKADMAKPAAVIKWRAANTPEKRAILIADISGKAADKAFAKIEEKRRRLVATEVTEWVGAITAASLIRYGVGKIVDHFQDGGGGDVIKPDGKPHGVDFEPGPKVDPKLDPGFKPDPKLDWASDHKPGWKPNGIDHNTGGLVNPNVQPNLYHGHISGDYTTAYEAYVPGHTLVEPGNWTKPSMPLHAGMPVDVNTFHHGDVLLRDPHNLGHVLSSDISHGSHWSLTGNSMATEIRGTAFEAPQMNPMTGLMTAIEDDPAKSLYFEVTNPSGQTGYIFAPYLRTP